MGGIGSGIWYRWEKSITTEEVPSIDIRYMRKQGLLYWAGSTGRLVWSQGDYQTSSILFRLEQQGLILKYRHRPYGKGQEIKELVWFDRTPCNYGGERLWFLCPQCRKRVAVLYGAGIRFLCRNCYALPYGSQNESYIDRMTRKARKIRRRLRAPESLLQPISEKPKGMHWKTFDCLVREEAEANEAWNFGMAEKFGIIGQYALVTNFSKFSTSPGVSNGEL